MQDRRDAGQDVYWTEGTQDMIYIGQDACRTAQMQDQMDPEQVERRTSPSKSNE